MIPFFLNKAWEYVKPHVVPLILFLTLAGVAYHYLTKHDVDVATLLKSQQDTAAVELKKITDAQDKEREAHAANLKRLEDTLNSVQKDHDDRIKKLEEKRETKVTALVKKYKDDPNGMAKQISDMTGFQLVLVAGGK